MSTYKELCSIANDLNQPDLIYKFLHLANHHATWNTKKVTFHYCIFYAIGHIVVLFYLYVSISVCVGLCITTCICPAFYAAILVINMLLLFSAS